MSDIGQLSASAGNSAKPLHLKTIDGQTYVIVSQGPSPQPKLLTLKSPSSTAGHQPFKKVILKNLPQARTQESEGNTERLVTVSTQQLSQNGGNVVEEATTGGNSDANSGNVPNMNEIISSIESQMTSQQQQPLHNIVKVETASTSRLKQVNSSSPINTAQAHKTGNVVHIKSAGGMGNRMLQPQPVAIIQNSRGETTPTIVVTLPSIAGQTSTATMSNIQTFHSTDSPSKRLKIETSPGLHDSSTISPNGFHVSTSSTPQQAIKTSLATTSESIATGDGIIGGNNRLVDIPVLLEDGSQVIVQQLINIDPVETTVETVSDSTVTANVGSHPQHIGLSADSFSFTGKLGRMDNISIINTSSVSGAGDSENSEIVTVAGAYEHVQDDEISGPPCPVCGDKVSGYHYGIFTCESCKGFFKRTVQNKKSFICHRKGECQVDILNRKKCPACRFKRCLVSGMKLEAVRSDRQRGGRSSYEGAQHSMNKPKGFSTPSVSGTPRRILMKPEPGQQVKRTVLLPSSSGDKIITMVYPPNNVISGTMPGSRSVIIQPHTPQMLEDLMAVESLMTEEEGEQDCCLGRFQPGDNNLFSSLLHLADHCLYKIVRWARNLPEFAHVSTDDQILLLQNSWGELLCVCCCWNSIRTTNALRLIHGRLLDMDMAQEMELVEMTQRLITYTEHLRSLELDCHEYVALKVMLLLNPDVKNLNDSSLIREHQENVLESLMIYTATHYPYKPNKFTEILARIAELTRSCVQAKDILKQRQSVGEIPQYSLLSELLKGDVVVQTA